jgi:hypothetical protein
MARTWMVCGRDAYMDDVVLVVVAPTMQIAEKLVSPHLVYQVLNVTEVEFSASPRELDP